MRFVEVDVTRMETISSAAARIEADFGKLDVLVNNAGIADPAEPGEYRCHRARAANKLSGCGGGGAGGAAAVEEVRCWSDR